MKSIIYFLFLLLFIPSGNSEKIINEIIPGVTHIHVKNNEIPWNINILKIDLNTGDLKLKTSTAFDSVAGNEKVSAMNTRLHNKGKDVIAAINADFYEQGGYSSNAQVEGGIIVKSPGYFSAFGINQDNDLHIGRISFSTWLAIDSNKVLINGVNRARAENEVILYNHYYGKSTRTNIWGSEFLLKFLTPPLINDTLKAVILDEKENSGNMTFSNNLHVLSAHNNNGLLLSEKLDPGDTLDLFIGLNGMPGKIETLVGGFVQLIKSGKSFVDSSFRKEGKEDIKERFVSFRHPRTAIGYTKDEKTFFMITVDGRQPSSAGMTLYELADFMLELGIWEALNLDGGGSTTMVIGNKIVNSPSDTGGERAVSNALVLIKEQ